MKLENCILLELWEAVLERFHKTSMQPQSADLDLNEPVGLLESLMNYTITLGIFDELYNNSQRFV